MNRVVLVAWEYTKIKVYLSIRYSGKGSDTNPFRFSWDFVMCNGIVANRNGYYHSYWFSHFPSNSKLDMDS
jgi:hypothetical protein